MPKTVTEQMLQTDTDVVEPLDQGDLQPAPESEGDGEAKVVADDKVITDDKTPPKYKYKSQDEAEKAYNEAVRKMTESNEKAARYEKMLANLSIQKQTPEVKESTAQKIAKEAMQRIRQITDDPNPDIYAEKAAIIWAEAQEKIADLKYGERHSHEQETQNVTTYAETKAREAGLKSQMAMEAFWIVARNAPKGISLDEQIDWSIQQVNTFIEEIRKESTEKTDGVEAEKKNFKVLGKGGKGPSSKETVVEMPSLGDALRAASNKRRLGVGDFK